MHGRPFVTVDLSTISFAPRLVSQVSLALLRFNSVRVNIVCAGLLLKDVCSSTQLSASARTHFLYMHCLLPVPPIMTAKFPPVISICKFRCVFIESFGELHIGCR